MKPITLALCIGLASSGAITTTHAAPISGQGTWETTLQGRDLDGDASTYEAYYDTVLNITWLADAFLSGSIMSWSGAMGWAENLDPYGSGITGWRLPNTIDVGNDGATYSNIIEGVDAGYNLAAHSELSHLFYVTLGNLAAISATGEFQPPGWGLTNTGPFSNVYTPRYWSATEYAPATNNAWYFDIALGYQYYVGKNDVALAWAVRDGDVGTAPVSSTVPLPASLWLLVSGLVGLVAARRRTI